MSRWWCGVLLACEPPATLPADVLPATLLEIPGIDGDVGHDVAIGDVNGDGLPDLLNGSPKGSQPGDNGRVDVAYGTPTGIDAWRSFRLAGLLPPGRFGDSLAAPGDLNFDGFDDLAVVASVPDPLNVPLHGPYLFFGSADGVHNAAAFRLDVSSFVAGNQDWTGGEVHAVGDLDGDGFSDLLILAPLMEISTDDTSAAWWWPGGANPSSPAGAQLIRSPQADLTLVAAAGAGDLDGDGYDDLAFGLGNDVGRGALWVVPGGPDGPRLDGAVLIDHFADGSTPIDYGLAVHGLGDVDGDGLADLLVASSGALEPPTTSSLSIRYGAAGLIDPAREVRIAEVRPNPDGHVPWGCDAGDVDGDGYADVLVAALDDVLTEEVYIFRGGPGGIDPTTSRRFLLPGNQNPPTSCAGGADLDADGRPDLAIGSPRSMGARSGDGGIWRLTWCDDLDADGLCPDLDCDDLDPEIGLGQTAYPDLDQDGWGAAAAVVCPSTPTAPREGDCRDDDGAVHPERAEIAGDGIDQDCDGLYLCWVDGDGDGYTSGQTALSSHADCAEAGLTSSSEIDCSDQHPRALGGDCSQYQVGDGDDQDDGVTPDEPEAKAGCGCATRGPTGAWLVALAAIGATRARRRRGVRPVV